MTMAEIAQMMKAAKIAARSIGHHPYRRNTERPSRQQRQMEGFCTYYRVVCKYALGVTSYRIQCAVSLGPFFLALFLLAGCDVVTSEYPTRADAEAKSLFARGWLPDFLPVSTANIVTHNNLDINTSWGEFRFEPSELDAFLARLTAGGEIPRHRSFDPLRKILKRHGSQDYRRYLSSNENHTWLFLVDPVKGHVFYCMWPNGRFSTGGGNR